MKSVGRWIVLAAGCAGAWLLQMGYGGDAALFLAVCSTVLLAYSLLLTLTSLQGLQPDRTLSGDIRFAGETLEVHARLSQNSLFPLPWLVVREDWTHIRTGASCSFRKLFFPWFRRRLEYRYRLTCLQRGIYRSEGVEVSTGDFFGFAVKTKCVNDKQFCKVYPQPAKLGIQPYAPAAGSLSSRRGWVQSPHLRGVRDYVGGDPLNRIHWKSTAKAGRLMSKELEPAASSSCMVLLDASSPAPLGDAAAPLLEQRIALAAGCFRAAAEGGWSCGFACSSQEHERIAPAIRSDLTLAYERLASVGGRPALSFPDLVRKEGAALPPDASMLCITSTLDGFLLRAALEARSRKRTVHVVYVHARPTLSVQDREGAAELQAAGCSFSEAPHPRSVWPEQGGVADATA